MSLPDVVITPRGIALLSGGLFGFGWLTTENFLSLIDLCDKGWDLDKPECRVAYTFLLQPACEIAATAQEFAVGRKLAREEIEKYDLPRGPRYAENRRLIVKARKLRGSSVHVSIN
jgi:hypothetical protein